MILQLEYSEEEVVERVDLDDEIVLLFEFYEEKDDIITVMDSNLNGEISNISYSDNEDLIAFRIEAEEEIKWPIIVRYYSVD